MNENRPTVIKERKPDAFAPIPCTNNYDASKPKANVCKILHGCGDNECTRKCVNCRKARCSEICNHYKPRQCEKLAKPPYACNGCPKKTNCMMDRKIYSSKYAQDTYEALRTTSRKVLIKHLKAFRNQMICCLRSLKRDNQQLISMLLMQRKLLVQEELFTPISIVVFLKSET